MYLLHTEILSHLLKRTTRLDEIKNFHSTDTIDTEYSGTRGRLAWAHSS